jgi:hypothetical protein
MTVLFPIQLLGYVLAGIAGHYDLAGDIDRNGVINIADLLQLLTMF